jgi:hypothetical protein
MTLTTAATIPSFSGELITPNHPGYDDARRVWHGAIDRRPSLIARPAGTRDVVRGPGGRALARGLFSDR